MKYTLGEWKARKRIDNSLPFEIYNSSENTSIAFVSSLNRRGSAEANANLMAAAPELLEALHTFCDLRTAQWDDDLLNAYHKAKQAIGKATE